MKSGKESFSIFKRSSFSSRKRRTRLLRYEELECRTLLSITAGEYDQIRMDLANFELPAQMDDLNIIELTDLTATGLQNAINTAAQTEKSDLVLFRSTQGNNMISLAGETIYVNIDPEDYGQLILYGGTDDSFNISVGGKEAPAFAFAMGDVKLANFNLVDIDLSVSFGVFATTSLVGNQYEVKNIKLYDINGNSVNPDEITLNKDAENKQKIEASANGTYSSGTKWADCDMSNNYAVIFAGGADVFNNHYRYYSAVLDLYTVLSTEYYIPHENIYILQSDGTDPAVDCHVSDGRTVNYYINSDVTYATSKGSYVGAATLAEFSIVMTDLSKKMDSDSHLLVYTYDHGGGTEGDPTDYNDYLCGWGEDLSGANVAAEMFKIKQGYVTTITAQCFSGGVIDDILDPATGVVLDATVEGNKWYAMAAANHYETSWTGSWSPLGPFIGFGQAAIDAIRISSEGAGLNNTEKVFEYAKENCPYAANNEVYNNNEGIWGGGEAIEHPWGAGASFDIFAPTTYTYIVDTTEDIVDENDGKLSLREAVLAAEAVGEIQDVPVIIFDSTLAGKTIVLNDAIQIGCALTIDGLLKGETAGITLSGNDSNRIFNISTTESVTLSGLIFEDGNSGENADGGAIYASAIASVPEKKVSLTIVDCQFSENTSTGYGGAIFIEGYVLSLSNTEFRRNTSQASGGAIYALVPESNPELPPETEVSFTITTCQFTGNATKGNTGNGGAIFSEGYALSLSDSKFENSTAQASGGAIYATTTKMDASLTVTNCEFVGSAAKGNIGNGGAIFSEGYVLSLSDSNFESNAAQTSGGAIYALAPNLTPESNPELPSEKKVSFKIENCQFNASNARGNGGAIFSEDHTLSLDNTKFDQSTSQSSGGAIYSLAPKLNPELNPELPAEKDVSFTIVDCEFITSTARGDGGAIFSKGHILSLSKTKFDQSTSQASGGAIYASTTEKDISFTIADCEFVTSTARGDGGVIFSKGHILSLDKTKFDQSMSQASGGAVYVSTAGKKVSLTIAACEFTGSSARGNGGTIFSTDRVQSILVSNTKFDQSTSQSSGGVIYTSTAEKKASFTIENCQFNASTAKDKGGAIFSKDYALSLNNTKFERSTSQSSGGAIYASTTQINVTFEIKNSQFGENFAKGDGGAVFNEGCVLSLSGTKFDHNSSQSSGGAIYDTGTETGDLTVSSSTFNQNRAALDGGAVYAYGQLSVSDSRFLNNWAVSGDGGGFFLMSGESWGLLAEFKNSDFLNNMAGGDGGAVCSTVSTSFENSQLSGNQAQGNGGAIYLANETDPSDAVLDLQNSFVTCNSAVGSGGGIYSEVESNFTMSRIDDNMAGSQGGGIYATANTLFVSCYVRQNSAQKDGAGIALAQSGTFLLKNSEISRNKTESNGGGLAIYQDQSGIAVNCTLVANSAVLGAGLYSAGTIDLYNSIVVENVQVESPQDESPQDENPQDENPQVDIYMTDLGSVVGKYTLSEFTSWTGVPIGCLKYDPETRDNVFEKFATGNYRPTLSSPTSNMGERELFVANGPEVQVDLAGRPRTSEEKNDLGAYEFAGSSTVLDNPSSLSITYDSQSPDNAAKLSWNAQRQATGILIQWSTRSDFTSVQEVLVPNTSPFDVPGLLSFTTYHFRAKAIGMGTYFDSEWSQPCSVEIKGTIRLEAPAIFTVQKDTATSVLVTWNAEQSALGYTLEYSTSPTFASKNTISNSYEPDDAGTITIADLAANTTYFFRIRSEGNGEDRITSEWSPYVYVVTLSELTAPSLVEANVLGCSSIEFALSPQNDAKSYTVQYYCIEEETPEEENPEENETYQFDETKAAACVVYTNFVIDGLVPDKKYLFRFKANAKTGLTDSPWTEVFSFATSDTLAAPVITTAKSESVSTIELTWTAVEWATGYVVQYRTGRNAWKDYPLSDSIPLDKPVVIMSNLSSDTSYNIRVQSVNGDLKESDYSAVQTVKTQADTDVILDNYCVKPLSEPALIGTFKKNDCHVFKLDVPDPGTNNNELFEIKKVSSEGDDLYQLWFAGKDPLKAGNYVVEIYGATSEDELDVADGQTLTIQVYQPVVIANTNVYYAAEDGSFSLSGFRQDSPNQNMTYQWYGDKDCSGAPITTGQTAQFSVSGNLRDVISSQDSTGDWYKTLYLRGVDANGIASEVYPVSIYTSANVKHKGVIVDTAFLKDEHICKLKLSVDGATATTWFVSWGDNTCSTVTVCSRDMTFVHYYKRANTYEITYKIISQAGTEYNNYDVPDKELLFTVPSSSPPVVQGTAANGHNPSGSGDSNQEPVIAKEPVVAAVIPEVVLSGDETPVLTDTGTSLFRTVVEPKASLSESPRNESVAIVLGDDLAPKSSTLRGFAIDELVLDFVQQKYKRSNSNVGLTSLDQYFAIFEDDTLV